MPEMTVTHSEALKVWRGRTGLPQREAAQKLKISTEVLIAIERGSVTITEETFNSMIDTYRQEWRNDNNTSAS